MSSWWAAIHGYNHPVLNKAVQDQLDIEYTGDSHIIPVITRKNETAVQLAALLQEKGFLIFPIRPPTVPQNQSRVKISLTADITPEDLAELPDLIKSTLKGST